MHRCLCDDCHIRVKVAQVKEQEPGSYNKFMDDGSVALASWWGANVKCIKGQEKMNFYRSAVKNKGIKTFVLYMYNVAVTPETVVH